MSTCVVFLEIGDVGADPGRGNAVGRRTGRVEQPLAIEPSQPAAVAIDGVAVGVLAMAGPGTAVFEQIAGHQGGLPKKAIRLRAIPRSPLQRRSGSRCRILVMWPSRVPQLEDLLVEVTNRGCRFQTGVEVGRRSLSSDVQAPDG